MVSGCGGGRVRGVGKRGAVGRYWSLKKPAGGILGGSNVVELIAVVVAVSGGGTTNMWVPGSGAATTTC